MCAGHGGKEPECVINGVTEKDIAQSIVLLLQEKLESEGAAVVLRETTIPAVLIEVGFLTNKEEREKLLSPEHQELLAEAIASGILDYDDSI